jgi:DNA-binding XRE family transcriptional regulator
MVITIVLVNAVCQGQTITGVIFSLDKVDKLGLRLLLTGVRLKGGDSMQTFNPLKVTERRRKLRKSLRDVARETGLSDVGIAHIEKGRKVPRADTLCKLADVLKCRVGYFFAGSHNNS